ncbi:MAG: rhodanese-like domain-containing protein [Verrucomicrobiota bacterium]
MKKMEVGNIEHEALKKAIAEESVTLIDVNGTKSFKTGHIPGAIDFIAEKESLAAKLPADKNALIVAYCSNENCGAYMKGAKAAQKLGYTNVKHYSAGIMGWKEKEEVEKG